MTGFLNSSPANFTPNSGMRWLAVELNGGLAVVVISVGMKCNDSGACLSEYPKWVNDRLDDCCHPERSEGSLRTSMKFRRAPLRTVGVYRAPSDALRASLGMF